MAVHHAVGISHQKKNSGYRPSRVNIMAQGLSTPDLSLSPAHLFIRRGSATTTHYIYHQASLMVSRNTTLVPSLGLRIGPACEACLSAGMRRERVSPQIRKKEELLETMKSQPTVVFTRTLGLFFQIFVFVFFSKFLFVKNMFFFMYIRIALLGPMHSGQEAQLSQTGRVVLSVSVCR